MRTRLVLAAAGVTATAYGVLLLLDDPLADLVSVVAWLVAGVLLHDLVLAPLVLLLAWAAGRSLPPTVRGPVAAGFVVLGAVTLVAVPVLGRFGASPGNETLLDRDYVAGWLLVAGITGAAVAVVVIARTWRRRRGVRAGR